MSTKERKKTTHSVHEIDEHVWTAPENASAIAGKIRDILIKEDPSNSGIYEENAAEYQERLAELDQEFRDVVGSAETESADLRRPVPFPVFCGCVWTGLLCGFPGMRF